MTSFFNFGRFGKQAGKANTPPINRQPSPTPTSPLGAPSPSPFAPTTTSQLPTSPPSVPGNLLDNSSTAETMQAPSSGSPRRLPFYFREENSTLIVKGNFKTLAAQPVHVDPGEWLAHQVVEQYRLLEGLIKIIQEVDQRTGLTVCNAHSCPQMSAGSGTMYTWLDNNKNPIRIPANQYILLVQKWILGKITDQKNFPTDPPGSPSSSGAAYQFGSSGTLTPATNAAGPTTSHQPLSQLSGRDWLGKPAGFPENFEHDIKALYRQMFRVYAHMYYAHWLEPYYHLGLYKELNTCFIHFVNVAREFGLLAEKEILPMQPLIDIWLSKGLLPSQSAQQTQQGQAAQQGSGSMVT